VTSVNYGLKDVCGSKQRESFLLLTSNNANVVSWILQQPSGHFCIILSPYQQIIHHTAVTGNQQNSENSRRTVHRNRYWTHNI